jgi:ATP-dependent DNA helicase RecQ
MAAAKKTAAKKTAKPAVAKKPTATKTAAKETKPKNKIDLHKALHEYFGFNKFKGTQEKQLNLCWQGTILLLSCLPVAAKVFVINYRH